ncbi:hypothetical protein AgCh_009124 [Apium graveolens]
MVAANEEVSRLTKINEKLKNEKQETKLLLVELEVVKQENAYLKNKLKCANEIEAVLREKLEKNKVKLKSFRNASELVGQYHEKNKPCANIDIGLNYDALNTKKKALSVKGKANENEDVPAMLKKVGSPISKACEVFVRQVVSCRPWIQQQFERLTYSGLFLNGAWILKVEAFNVLYNFGLGEVFQPSPPTPPIDKMFLSEAAPSGNNFSMFMTEAAPPATISLFYDISRVSP